MKPERQGEEGGNAKPMEKLTRLFRTALSTLTNSLALVFGINLHKRQYGDDEDKSTQLAYARTELAMGRTFMALERTLQAWIRTALSMISFGFTIGKLGTAYLHDIHVKGVLGVTHTLGIKSMGYFLVLLGTLALLGATVQYRLALQALYANGLRRRLSIAFIIAILLTVAGVFAFSSLAMNL